MFQQVAQFIQDRPDYGMMRHDDGWYSLASFIFFMLVIVVLAMVAYRMVYAKHGPNGGATNEAQDPLAIAKIRFAKGEITKDDFAELKKQLAD